MEDKQGVFSACVSMITSTNKQNPVLQLSRNCCSIPNKSDGDANFLWGFWELLSEDPSMPTRWKRLHYWAHPCFWTSGAQHEVSSQVQIHRKPCIIGSAAHKINYLLKPVHCNTEAVKELKTNDWTDSLSSYSIPLKWHI